MSLFTKRIGAVLSCKPRRWFATLLPIVLLFGFSSSVFAQHIYIDPRAESRLSVTDNANLTETDKISDAVLNNAIGFNARIDGSRTNIAVDYSLDHFLFLSDGGSEYRQNLFGTLDAEIWRDHLTVNGRASIRQQFLDQRSSLSGSGANRTTNRRSVQSYTGTGIFRTGIRDFADARVTYRFGVTASPADNLDDETLPVNFSDSTSHEIFASIDSGDRFQAFQWRLFAESSRVFRSLDVNDFRRERAGADLTFKFNRFFQLTGNVNVSSNDFQSDVLSEEGLGWEAGFRWTPGRKLDLAVSYGREGAREIWYAQLQHFFSVRFDFRGSYTDTITANTIVLNDNLNSLQFRGDEGIFSGGGLPIDETDPTFSFADTDFRRRAATGTFTLRQRRTTSYFTGNIEWRTFDDGTGTGRSWGLSSGIDHKINERTTISARLSYRQSLFDNGVVVDTLTSRVDDIIVGNLSWTETLSEYIRIALSYDHTQRISNVDGQDIQENVLTFYLRGTF